jgi:exopolysaccharide biosynthesis protein
VKNKANVVIDFDGTLTVYTYVLEHSVNEAVDENSLCERG